MLPRDLKPEQFAGYPPEARGIVLANLDVLRKLPLIFLVSLLREILEYDYKFPRERAAIDKDLANLRALSPAQMNDWFHDFSALSLSSKLEKSDWVNRPAQFLEQESAYLWTTHQLDAFRKAATDYGDRLRAALPDEPIPERRLGIAIIGQGVTSIDGPLFRNLRAHGTYFANVKPESGVEQLLKAVSSRAQAHPVPYAHWYIDGGQPAAHSPLLTCVSYGELEPVRAALLKYMRSEVDRPGMGPEELRTKMAQLLPADLGVAGARDEVLSRFELKILSEGSGTQIFSTTFAQWTAREVLRRAEPLTLLVRFAPRQAQRPMNELLFNSGTHSELDPAGSLIDGDMAAYYQWINQQRLAGSEKSTFLVWFEGHKQAMVISPSLPRGTVSDSALSLAEIVSLATG